MLIFNTRFTFQMPVGTISESGKNLIEKYMREQRLYEGAWMDKNPDTSYRYLWTLPDAWDWTWVVTGKGDYVGTFPKRVSKYFHVHQKLKCPPEFLTELGNIARAHSGDAITYEFEFVDTIEWDAGDFGDYGSCWWGSYSDGKDAYASNGGCAICFYDSEGKGKGRAWIIADTNEENTFYVFNGYGFNGDATLLIARIIASHLGLSYKKVELSNQGHAYQTIYINGASGYAIAAADILEKIESYDLDIEVTETESCDNCGDTVHEENTYSGPGGEGTYCERCYYNLFSSCEHCGETYDEDDVTYVTDTGSFCDDCLSELFTRCEDCEDYHRHEDVTIIDDSAYCESCRDEKFKQCDECEEWKLKGTLTEKEDKHLCEGCNTIEE